MNQLFRRKSTQSILNQIERDRTSGMKRSLNVRDLTAMGIAAIIGAGIFSTIGGAAVNGGPAVSLLFVFTAIACGFSALCYAQFASSIPISGSAYTYAYNSFGEIIAWIIGWDLIMEYAVGNIAVAISWSDYFTGMCFGLGMHIPEYMSVDFLSASRGFHEVQTLMQQGIAFGDIKASLREAYLAYSNAPAVGNIRLIADIPAFSIVIAISALVFIGIYESKVASNLMVLLKVIILLLVISVGAVYINPENWSPFAPNGAGGVLKGISGVFFAYIGFDAISTTAEECKNPKRDLPRAMIWALVITTVLYVLISLVLTGMVHYSELGVGDPLAYAFEKVGLTRFSGIIALSAIIAMASVLLVFQVGQPRIWMSMSRDGLLPPLFSRLHKRFRTPWFATIITAALVAIPSLFMNLTEVTDLTSIGTLFAFALVSAGVLFMDEKGKSSSSFKVPYLSSRYVLLFLWIAFAIFLSFSKSDFTHQLKSEIFTTDFSIFKHQIPFLIFLVFGLVFSFFAIKKNYSAIPTLGLLINLYLMSQLGITNWLRFLIWLAIGLVIYFSYGYKKSLLRMTDAKS